MSIKTNKRTPNRTNLKTVRLVQALSSTAAPLSTISLVYLPANR